MTTVAFGPSKGFARQLAVDRNPAGYHVSIRSPVGTSLGFCSCGKDELSIYAPPGERYLIAGLAQFPISEKEAARLVATFDIEVQT